MPYMLLHSLDLPLDKKREIARELASAVIAALQLPEMTRKWTTVQFAPFRLEDVAIAGQLAADTHTADYHLDYHDRRLTYEKKAALVQRLTPLLARLLNVPPDQLDMINILFYAYEPDDMAIGGRFISDMERQRPYEALERGPGQSS